MNLDLFTKRFRLDKTIFDDSLMSKDKWSFAIGVSKRTLQRWEKEIVNNSILKNLYHSSKDNVSRALDGYKRLILLAIYQLKNGLVDNKRHTNKSAIKWIENNRLQLIRLTFNQWRSQDVN